MSINRIGVFVIALAVGVLAAACSFGPPPSCGENIGGTADTVKFEQYFTNMNLVNEASGQPGPAGENGMEFSPGESLAIQVESKSAVELRACIQPLSGGNKIAFDQTKTLSPGQGTVSIGTFEQGKYVIRVIVGDILVKNFPFVIK